MGCCNCGFGNGATGGGSGNLSGTLTPPQFPSATGPNALGDSQLSDHGSFILMEGGIHTQNEGNNYFNAYVAGTSGEHFQFQFSRGTLLAPLDVVIADHLGQVDFLGQQGSDFVLAAYIRAVVSDAVAAGVVPGRLEFHAASDVGVDTKALQLQAEESTMYGHYQSEGTRGRNRVALSETSGFVDVNTDLADFFSLEVNGNWTLAAPSGFFLNGKNRVIRFRTRQAGLGGFTLAFDPIYKFPGGVPIVIAPTAGAYDIFEFEYNEDAGDWLYAGGVLNIT